MRLRKRHVLAAALGGGAVAAWLVLPALRLDRPTGKSGGRAVIALRLAVAEERGTPGADLAEAYARRVGSLSDGSLRVAISYWPDRFEPGTPEPRIERDMLDAVRSNAVELGLVPAHALSVAGVSTLDALAAPFAITSLPHALRVAESPLAVRLQAGVDRLALTPLGLIPEGMYRAFGFLKPLEVPADFAGATVVAPLSGPVGDSVRALGASPLEGGNSETGVYSGFSKGPEALRTANDAFPQHAYTTGDFALLAKMDVALTSGSALSRLRSEQRAILARAVADTRRATLEVERKQAAAFCRGGGTIVASPPGAVRDLRARAARVLARLRRDPETRALLEGIDRLRPQARAMPLRPCEPAATAAGDRPTDDELFREDSAIAWPAFAGSFRRPLAAGGSGDFATLTFYGTYPGPSFQVEWPGSNRPTCRGRADVRYRGGVLVWNPATPCSGSVALSWRLDGRDLLVTGVAGRTRESWADVFVGAWKRVDCTPWVPPPGIRDFAAQETRRKQLEHGFCR